MDISQLQVHGQRSTCNTIRDLIVNTDSLYNNNCISGGHCCNDVFLYCRPSHQLADMVKFVPTKRKGGLKELFQHHDRDGDG